MASVRKDLDRTVHGLERVLRAAISKPVVNGLVPSVLGFAYIQREVGLDRSIHSLGLEMAASARR